MHLLFCAAADVAAASAVCARLVDVSVCYFSASPHFFRSFRFSDDFLALFSHICRYVGTFRAHLDAPLTIHLQTHTHTQAVVCLSLVRF